MDRGLLSWAADRHDNSHGSAINFSFGWESVSSLLSDPATLDLIEQQYAELAHLPDRIPLEVDFDRMRKAEAQGAFKVWVARVKISDHPRWSERLTSDGDLAGIIELQIVPHVHYRSTLFAMECGHFLDPAHRSAWLWLAMWRTAMAALRELNVKILVAHDNANRPMPTGYRRLGFSPDGAIYMKAL